MIRIVCPFCHAPLGANELEMAAFDGHGERLVKRLHRRAGRVALVAENPSYPTLEIQEGMEVEVWGVVVGKFKRLVA